MSFDIIYTRRQPDAPTSKSIQTHSSLTHALETVKMCIMLRLIIVSISVVKGAKHHFWKQIITRKVIANQ